MAKQDVQKTNTMAILGFIFSFFFAIVGLILSIIALNQIKKDPSQEGKGLAVAGLVISLVSIGLVVLIYIIYIVAIVGLVALNA